MTAGARRLYFALWPGAALRAEIVAATASAVAAAGGRAVAPDALHVTLAFLGGVPADRYGDAVAAARSVRGAPGHVTFDRLAAWGRGGPLVLEATAVAEPLRALQAALATALEAAGFQLDRRPFRPHITLSRRPARRPAGGPVEGLGWRYENFVLVDSETRPEGPRYTVAETFALR